MRELPRRMRRHAGQQWPMPARRYNCPAAALDRQRPEADGRDAAHAARTAGPVGQVPDDQRDDLAEGERDDGQVLAAGAHAGQAEQNAERGGDQAGQRQRQPRILRRKQATPRHVRCQSWSAGRRCSCRSRRTRRSPGRATRRSRRPPSSRRPASTISRTMVAPGKSVPAGDLVEPRIRDAEHQQPAEHPLRAALRAARRRQDRPRGRPRVACRSTLVPSKPLGRNASKPISSTSTSTGVHWASSR